MSEFDPRRIDDAFEEFRRRTAPRLKRAGLGPVRATVRYRRDMRTAAGAVAAVLVVLLTAGYTQIKLGHRGPTVTAPSSLAPGPSLDTGPSTGPVPDPAMPSARPSGCARPSGAKTNLCGATLDIPPFAGAAGCPSGRIGFTNGVSAGKPMVDQLTLTTVGRADLDHDGVPETVALVECMPGYSVHDQVLAFRSDASMLGRVVATGGPIAAILDVAVSANGSVRAMVSGEATPGRSIHVPVMQWRTYAWTGQGFAQTGGSTSFTADHASADLTVTASPITLDILRHGRVTVTVQNRGTQPVAPVSLFLSFVNTTVSGPGCEPSKGYWAAQVCTVGTLAAGATWQRTFTLEVWTGTTTPTFQSPDDGGIQLKLGDQIYTELYHFTVTS
jgi:hypothetical protein